MKKENGLFVLAAVVGSLVGFASHNALGADEVLGKMGNVELRTSDMKALLDTQPADARKKVAEDLTNLDRLVRTELVRSAVLAEVRANGWDRRPEVVAMMERAREQVLVSSYVNELARANPNYPSEDEIKAFYDANKVAFAKPAEYQIAQIFVAGAPGADKRALDSGSKKAAELAAKAQKPKADFYRLAREESEHLESVKKGGDMGWLPDEQLIPEVRAVVANMSKGEVSAAIRSPQGWHIIRLSDKKASSVRPLPEVRAAIVTNMRLRKAQENENAYMDSLLAKSPVAVNQIELTRLQQLVK